MSDNGVELTKYEANKPSPHDSEGAESENVSPQEDLPKEAPPVVAGEPAAEVPSEPEPEPSVKEERRKEEPSAATFENEPKVEVVKKESAMADSERPPANTGYTSFEDKPSGSGEKSAIPSRYQPSSQLAEDLRNTASGRRRTRRTTRRTPHYKIDADSDESDGSSIDEDFDVDSILSSIEEGLTWRGRMQHALHNHIFHIVIVVLVCLDALIVMFELLLDVGAFNNRQCSGETPFEQKEFCHYNTRGRCAPTAIQIIENINISASPGTGMEALCRCRFRSGLFVCDLADGPVGVNPALILHVFSLIILTIFLFEIILKIVAFRLKYFTHKFEVFDGMVVVVSWVLDVASIVEEEAFEAAALIIVLRLWRVVRIVNGAVLSSKAQSDRQLEEARAEARKIIHAFHKCQDKLDIVEEHKVKLMKQVEASGGRVPAEMKEKKKNNGF